MHLYFQVILGKFQKIQRKNIVVNTILLVIISFLWILILVSWASEITAAPVPTAFVMVMICMILFTLQSQWKITEIGICPGIIPLVILGIVTTAALSQSIWYHGHLGGPFGGHLAVSNNSGA